MLKLRAVNYSTTMESISGNIGRSKFLTTRTKAKEFTVPLSAGLSDILDVMRDKEGSTYVLSRNFLHGYVGLEVFDPEGEQLYDMWFSDESELYLVNKVICGSAANGIKTLDARND